MAGSYFHMNEFGKAVKMYNQLLKLADALEDVNMQLDTYKWLGESCFQLTDFQAPFLSVTDPSTVSPCPFLFGSFTRLPSLPAP